MRDYRMWLLRDGPAKRSRVYVNSVLTALDDFHVRRGLGKADVAREDLRKIAPRALEECARIRWLRAVEAHLSPRGRCIALIPYYAGARISEVVRLDVGDVQMWARKGRVRLYGKGGKFREVDIHPKLRTELRLWLDERPKTTVRAEVAFTNGDLVAKGQDLDVLVPISHRQQPQRSEGVRDG
ncbi:tyrosine-type recombinase/integrase [Nonomuraea dietziae]|uniref:tyrosine-type recombinase/integrase n=1 Tax=Nonomuraea dietziae TaxID=65515 RepID=UPI003405AA94